ncbi:urease accessory protein UreD [Halobacillus shinanisalinarum]|uniref:Urease accessory protein UreD n=1 Tax=Halobacillus shinanisalinarum TaxID=2932258 RepID=A0ABY4H3J9_9BACI|nr:urease accessory protein UreD [Halobacillus shinanisalinarum]UOQ94743.1 urease accessory protein UreD [Halobacillus shinanisalinarum]
MEFQKRNNRTLLTNCFQQPPLKASRELYLSNKEKATVYIMESSGGMVAGDCNEFDVHLMKDANVCLRQQSATKVYPSLNELSCVQHFSVKLDERARLEWTPEVIIPFEHARFSGNTNIQMKQESTLLWGEIIAPGREKRNECFHYDDFRSSFQIWLEEECLAYDTLHLSPAMMPLQQMGLLENSLYIGSLWFVSPVVQEVNLKDIHEQLQESEQLKASVTSLEGKGVHIRWLGSDLWLMKKEINKLGKKFIDLQK